MKIIYFYHTPKCGGTTINYHLKRMCKSLGGEYTNFNYAMRKLGKLSLPLRMAYHNFKYKSFLKGINNETKEFKFVHHHHGFYGLSEIRDEILREKALAKKRGNEFYLFTCIREPRSYQISLVNYLRQKFGRTEITIESSYRDSILCNSMYKYLLHNHSKRWEGKDVSHEEFLKTFALFDRVFILDQLDEFYEWIQDVTGYKVIEQSKVTNASRSELKPTPDELLKIDKANELDKIYYDMALQKNQSK